jgi:hypothetical protein
MAMKKGKLDRYGERRKYHENGSYGITNDVLYQLLRLSKGLVASDIAAS